MKVNPSSSENQVPLTQRFPAPKTRKIDPQELVSSGLIKPPKSLQRLAGEPPEQLLAELEEVAMVAGMSLSQIREVLDKFLSDLPPPQTREERVSHWVVKGELRKMAILDQFLTGFLRG